MASTLKRSPPDEGTAPPKKRRATESTRKDAAMQVGVMPKDSCFVLTAASSSNLSRTSSTSGTADSKLMSLPAELRNKIYTYALVKNSKIGIPKYYQSTEKKWREPKLLAVCKQIREEARPLYYANNSFEITTYIWQIHMVAAWISSRIGVCASPSFHELRIDLLGGPWTELDRLSSFLQLIRRLGLSLSAKQSILLISNGPFPDNTSGRKLLENSVKVMRRFANCYDEALCQALTMAENANKEGWSEECLDFEFCSWFEKKDISASQKNGSLWWRYRKWKRAGKVAKFGQLTESSSGR